MQTLPAQHPVGHEVASHTHTPPLHRCPLEQAGPPPQVHPPLAQPSATCELQVVQPLPPLPHALTLAVMHVEPLQHPPGHEVASQVHAPPTHAWPAAHCAPEPQAHEPLWQESARIGSQATHAAPPAPQVAADGALHVVPVQQPLVQVWAHPAHTPLTHDPPAQSVHEAPPTPQAVGDGVVQTLPLQHPFGHEAASHSQAPFTHAWPAAHAAPEPQAHEPFWQESAPMPHPVHAAPPVPQEVTDRAWHTPPAQHPVGHDVESQTHVPLAQRCPAAHPVPPPHAHEPFTHALDPCASHAMHEAPPVPHAARLGALHVAPAQHPFGHEVASQTHVPPRQRCPAPHAAAPPQLQAPPLQLSARLGSHAPHAAPPAPHAAADGLVHAPPAQHPFGQEAGPQAAAPSLPLPSADEASLAPSPAAPSFAAPSFAPPSPARPSSVAPSEATASPPAPSPAVPSDESSPEVPSAAPSLPVASSPDEPSLPG